MKVVVFLEWKEKCFRVSAEDLSFLKSLLPRKAEVKRVKSERAFLKELKTATHVITWHFRKEWYQLAPKLKLLATPAAGRELVEPPPPTIQPFNLSTFQPFNLHYGHYHGAFMAESVAAFCLAWARGFFKERPDAWSRAWLSDKVMDLAGSRAVILGYGNVGKAIGAKLEALGVEVHGYSRHRPLKPCELKKLDPDWLILALPSTTGTDDMIDAAFLNKLPRKCVLVNVGRGNSVDEKALIAALKAGRLAGAYLDVIKNEPSGTVPLFSGSTIDVAADDPAEALGLKGKLVLMPHSSAFSPMYLKECFKELENDGCFRS